MLTLEYDCPDQQARVADLLTIAETAERLRDGPGSPA